MLYIVFLCLRLCKRLRWKKCSMCSHGVRSAAHSLSTKVEKCMSCQSMACFIYLYLFRSLGTHTYVHYGRNSTIIEVRRSKEKGNDNSCCTKPEGNVIYPIYRYIYWVAIKNMKIETWLLVCVNIAGSLRILFELTAFFVDSQLNEKYESLCWFHCCVCLCVRDFSAYSKFNL